MSISGDYSNLDFIAAPIFVLEISDAGTPVYAAVNAHALKISGRALSDYLGRTAFEVYPMAYGRMAYDRHCDVLKSGRALTYEIDLPLKDKIATFKTTLRPEMDAMGRVLRLFGSCQDMTAEQHALDAKAEFDTLSSEMEQFVAFAAHDLRAPMRNIAALTAMMRDECSEKDDKLLEIVDLIDNIATNSIDLISDVLAHAQSVSSEKQDSEFSFPVLCENICATLDPQRQHSFTISSVALRADRAAIQIALRNITENAIKHGSRSRLDIDMDVQPGMPGMIEVTLTDNGGGFTDAALRVMNGGRFRADSGYGLFGVKRLISGRGGTLVARNLPDNQGAVVRFSLPGSIIERDIHVPGQPQKRQPPPHPFTDGGRLAH